jgi:hypothetical protein
LQKERVQDHAHALDVHRIGWVWGHTSDH